MTLIGDVLGASHVRLSLKAREEGDAIREVLAQLNGDSRVKDFPALTDALFRTPAARLSEHGCGICLAHGRTESVSSLVMSAGRSAEGIACPELPERVHLIFVAGIPAVLNADYLRVVGAIARVCQDRHQVERLLAVRNGRDFVALLEAGEARL